MRRIVFCGRSGKGVLLKAVATSGALNCRKDSKWVTDASAETDVSVSDLRKAVVVKGALSIQQQVPLICVPWLGAATAISWHGIFIIGQEAKQMDTGL